MAQKVTVQLVDDLDGTSSEDVSTVLFGLDGVSYEIDMSEANADRLRDSLAEYVESARRTGGRVKRGTKPRSQNGTGPSEASQIREWAQENGFELSARGRIPSHVVEAYKRAHATPEPVKKPAKSRARTKKR